MINLIIDSENKNNSFTLVDYVYDLIKTNILNWNLKPGLRISEKDISDHLKISKTPVRESFIRLSKEKLIDILPQRGSFVSKIDLNDVEESYFIRRSLELSVLELAVTRLKEDNFIRLKELVRRQRESIKNENYAHFLSLDEEFHKEIFLGSQREMTWKVMSDAGIQYKRVRMLTLIDINKYDIIVEEHSELVSSLEKKDIESARSVINEHLGKLNFEEELLKNKYPDYFL
ncbi:MAG: GntR family transcriptional regulator [Spirochaetes bacterium]|nr:GntR family transcriptional regulator [Spirochaetota bacterium]